MRTGDDDEEPKSPEFQTFLSKWRRALVDPKLIWEGRKAVRELRAASYGIEPGLTMLDFIRCDEGTGWRPREMLDRVIGEVEDYKQKKQAWSNAIRRNEARKVELFLTDLSTRASSESTQVYDPFAKKLLKRMSRKIQTERADFVRYTKKAEISPLGRWEGLWKRAPRRASIERAIALDSRLQEQSAKMLRTFLGESVSLRTIARLVLLVYIACDLAKQNPEDGQLWIAGERRTISVRSIEEKLRRAKIKTPSY
jgi:hypothetical protein